MLQTIQGHLVKVIDLKEMPKLPITWDHPDEKPYAQALHDAIFKGMITEPGKYGIEVIPGKYAWDFEFNIYVIQE